MSPPERDCALRRLAIGTVQFGSAYGVSNRRGQVPREEVAAVLADAAGRGVDLLDTAAAYGSAEDVLGALRPLTDGFRVITKTARLGDGGVNAVVARARESLARMGRSSAAGILVHAAGDLRGPEGEDLWAAMLELRDEGLYDHLGISAYARDNPLELARRFRPGLMQLPVSMLDQRLVQDGTLKELAGLGVEIHARSIFLQGLVFLDPRELPPRLSHARHLLEDRARRVAESDATMLQAALHFVLARPEIARVVVGVTSLVEWKQIAGTASSTPPQLAWDEFALDDPVVLDPSAW